MKYVLADSASIVLITNKQLFGDAYIFMTQTKDSRNNNIVARGVMNPTAKGYAYTSCHLDLVPLSRSTLLTA